MDEGGIVLIILLILGVPIVVAIWLVVRAVQTGTRIDELAQRLRSLEAELLRLKKEHESTPPAEHRPIPEAEVPQAKPTPQAQPIKPEPVKPAPIPPTPEIIRLPPLVTPPPIPPRAEPVFAQASAPEPQPAAAQVAKTPPVMEPYVPARDAPSINWEQFLGVKLFAWVGGLALFLAVAFFVKYSFDNNLISPEMRVAIGFIIGIALVVGGVVTSRKNYLVLSQTLCATGIVILYAITFAARSYYHILWWPGTWWDALPAFAIMALITTTGFTLAVRLNALVVAILGMLGGFLTPVLLSTGVDNPGGLFGYIAILDAGLIVIAVHRRWSFLTALAAAGTAMMQIAWAGDFFVKEKYFEGNKIYVALAILLGFIVLYLAAAWWTKRRAQTDRWLSGSTFGLVTVALGFTLSFLNFEPLAHRPWLVFSFVFLIDLGVIALVLLENEMAPAQPIVGLAVFGLLAFWTANSLTNDFLNAALVFYFIFAIVHSIFPVWLQRTRGARTILWGSQIFPPLALVLVLIPLFHFTPVSLLIWPFVLLVDVLAIALAVITASILPVLIVLLLTLAATGALIFKIPVDTLTGLPTSFFLLGAFAVFFFVISIWLVRKFSPNMFRTGQPFGKDVDLSNPADIAAILPACSAVLPFLLLIMATMRLPLENPSPVFGLALLLVVLLLGVTRLLSMDWMPAIGLFCVTALECAWHFSKFDTEMAVIRPAPVPPLVWYLVFFAVFAVFPFLFLRRFSEKIVPWAAAALAGPAQFLLVYRLVRIAYPNQVMGLLPAAFAIPPLLSLFVVLKNVPTSSPARMSQLAWFGGVALFFITLIFPIQFENQWITIGWALEGAALLWLFHRVPHPGLRVVGVGLLVAAFVRLAFNPYVLDYHRRAAIPIFNWYLYAYGIVTVCLFAGASLLAAPRNKFGGINAPPILFTLGTILAFLLLNIEIADYFGPPGSRLTFEFTGNFARDMTYSIAWALFALVLLVVGIWKKLPGARYSALGLLSVTILKLFFHDLASLNQLYRIGAFLGVAVIAILASVAYQRFFATVDKKVEPQNETVR